MLENSFANEYREPDFVFIWYAANQDSFTQDPLPGLPKFLKPTSQYCG